MHIYIYIYIYIYMPKTKPVSLMLFLKCVQMLPFRFTCLMLSRHQVLS